MSIGAIILSATESPNLFTLFTITALVAAAVLANASVATFLATARPFFASSTILSRPSHLASLPAFSTTQSITALMGANIASMPFNRFCATGLFFIQSLTTPVSESNPSMSGWNTPIANFSKSSPILTMLSHTASPLPVKIPTTKSVKWSKKSDIGIIISSSIVTILCSIGLSLVQSRRDSLMYFHIKDNAITISPTIFKPANNLGSAFAANIGSLLNNLLNILPIPPPPILPKTPVSLDNNLPPMFPKNFVIGLKILLKTPPILLKIGVSLDNNLPPMFPKNFVIGLKILLKTPPILLKIGVSLANNLPPILPSNFVIGLNILPTNVSSFAPLFNIILTNGCRRL